MADASQDSTCITYGQMNLINRMRRLWMQLALWRRAYLISAAADFGDLDLVANRLYYAPNDFKHLFEAFFGEEIAEGFQQRLTGQIILVNRILNAIKEGDSAAVDENTLKLYANADEMAAFLSEINPYWDEQRWKDLLYKFYRSIILEMVMILAGRYEEAITLYESLEDQVLKIANYMADGFIKYFY